jgi:cold shock CspA family protein
MEMQNQQQQQIRTEGTVFSYKPTLGYGFLYYDGQTLFVHKNDISEEAILSAGDPVEFSIGKDFKGRPCAKNVRRIDGTEGLAGNKASESAPVVSGGNTNGKN